MAVSSRTGSEIEIIAADWPAAAHIHACTTTRKGGVSRGVYQGLNLATHVHDDAGHVARNREILAHQLKLPAEPVWLNQVHSARVIRVDATTDLTADAACTDQPGAVCAVLTADCLPVFFTDAAGSCVGIAHAGWRGLHAGVISATLEMMQTLAASAGEIMVWLGPAIGPNAFEVGAEVVEAFSSKNPANSAAFTRTDADHWLCDIYRLARTELALAGVEQVYGGGLCTHGDAGRFYSWRREGETGRMASLIWMDPAR